MFLTNHNARRCVLLSAHDAGSTQLWSRGSILALLLNLCLKINYSLAMHCHTTNRCQLESKTFIYTQLSHLYHFSVFLQLRISPITQAGSEKLQRFSPPCLFCFDFDASNFAETTGECRQNKHGNIFSCWQNVAILYFPLHWCFKIE